MYQLMPFQKKVVKWIKENNGCGLIALEMGLGKTIIASEIIRIANVDYVLVICPSHLKYHWADTIKEHCGEDVYIHIVEHSNWQPDKALSSKNIYIVSYNVFTRIFEEFYFMKYGKTLVILDEAHYIKNLRASRTKAVYKFISTVKPKMRLALTGTPVLSYPIDIYSIVNFVKPGALGKFRDFVIIFTIPRRTPWGMDYSTPRNLKRLYKWLTGMNLIYRLTWEDVDIEIPPLIRIPVVITRADENLKKVSEGIDIERPKMAHISQYRLYAGKLKLEPSVEFVKNKLEEFNKIVVFAYHREITQGIAKRLSKHVDTKLIIGGISAKEKRKIEKWFNQEDGQKKVIVANFEAGGTGMNLQTANCVVFAELDWTPAVLEQAERRIYRIGTKKKCFAFYLIVDDFIEKTLIRKLNIKSTMIGEMIENKKDKKFLETRKREGL